VPRLKEGRAITILVPLGARRRAGHVAALDAAPTTTWTKPFGAEELLARVRVALRRTDGVGRLGRDPPRRSSRSISIAAG
jgi:DNA-binding response OmpR family regulator